MSEAAATDEWVAVRVGLFEIDVEQQDPAGRDRVLLAVGRCVGCGAVHFPRPTTCPDCGGDEVDEVLAGGAGATLWGFTSVQAAPPGYRGPVPYGFGVVELAEGIRVVSRITETEVGRLRRGLPGHFVLDDLHRDDDGRRIVTYAFAPDAPS